MSIHCKILPNWQTTRHGTCNRTLCKSKGKEGCGVAIYKQRKKELSQLSQRKKEKLKKGKYAK